MGGQKQEKGRHWREDIKGYHLLSVLHVPGTQLSIKCTYDM